MDCEACNNLLLDHLYEELDEVRSAAIRKHLEGCAECSAAFERLAGGRRVGRLLPLVDAPLPNAALHEAIHAAALAQSRPRASGVSDDIAPVIPIGATRRVPRWLSRVGEMAMRRQVAMAAVFLLMVGFGLGYHQFQAPTRPVQLTDEPSAEVIPATELPSSEGTAAPETAARAHNTRRPSGVEPRNEHRDTAAIPTRAAQPAATRTAEPAPTQRVAIAEENENAVAQAVRNQQPSQLGATPESPAAYRSFPPTTQNNVGSIALGQRVSGDRGLDQALPRSPLDNGGQRNVWVAQQPTQAQSAAPSTAATNTSWRSLRDAAESHRARGQTELAVAAFRDALAQDPPDADRRAIAQALYETLLQSGQVREASVVQGRYLARPTEVNALANEVNAESQTTQSTSRPAASRPMPSHATSRSRRAPSQADSYSNVAY